jgi:PAS domain S-box-containing protein
MVADYAHGWEFWTDPGGNLVYISPNTKEITGYSAAQFRDDASLLERIILPEDIAVWKSHMREIHQPEARNRSSCTFRIRTKSGEVRWIEHRCTSITSSKGVYLGRRGSNIDITDQLLQQQTLEQNLREKEVMLQEIHHRVKNNLQVVSSLISLQMHAIQDQEILNHLDSIAGRISTMGTLHSTIYREDSFGRVNMKEYIESIIAQLDTTAVRSAGIDLSLSVTPIELELSEALPCGLIINEATTNAFKYAFPEVRRGKIWIELSFVTPEKLRLSIADNGVGLPPDSEDSGSASRGIGFELITALADQLGGEAHWRNRGGLAVEVEFPKHAQE